MLDPVVTAALVVLVAWGLKSLLAYLSIPVDEGTINTLAAVIVAWLLSLFGLEVIKATVAKKAPQYRGLFKE
jgi:hypothetical protein